jgi:hypothetical protein
MTYYSKNNEYPTDGLPFRIVLSNGSTRTDPSTFTSDEIADAGYSVAPNPPSVPAGWTLTWDGMDWSVADLRLLDELKTQKILDISVTRKQAEENFTFSGMSIRLDEGTQSRIDGALNGLERKPAGTTVPWQVSPGVFTEFDVTTMETLALAAFDHVEACFDNAQVLVNQINAATTNAEVDAVDLEIGWP